MARIYVSSTFNDLKKYREHVRLQLRQMGHEDIAMEYYVAENQRPLDKCLKDVASCDLYIGIFAQIYGYIPPEQQKSITELEYRTAVDKGKDRLIFLLDEEASWPTKFVDKGKNAEKISLLRNELSRENLVSFFKDPHELKSLIATALHNWEKKDGVIPQKKEAERDSIAIKSLIWDITGKRDWMKKTKNNQIYSFIAKHSGKCLDVSRIGKENGAELQQWDWSRGDNQKWKLTVVEFPL